MRRSICTSEPRRASTRVSSGFTLFEHSSPSFGSHRTRSDRNGAESATVRQRCATPSLKSGWLSFGSLSLSLSAFDLPRTRAHARLLGPCFKTGPMRPESSASLALYVERAVGRASEFTERLARPSTRATLLRFCRTAGDDGRRDGRGDSSLRVRIHLRARRSAPSVRWKGPAAWALIRTVSRTVELSFQSSFHLSLAVLVRYRSRARIEPWMESTTRLWAAIPNNPTLGRRSSGGAPSGPRARGSHPLRRSLPRKLGGRRLRRDRFPRSTTPTLGVGFQPWAGFPLHSPLLRESWLVSRPPPSDMLKFGG